MTNEKARRISPGFDTTREAYKWLTPTDDEREAQTTEVYGIINSHYWSTTGKAGVCACGYDVDAEPAGTMAEHRAQKVIDAGFRRSEVPEPSGRMIDTYTDSKLRTAFGLPEPQGEPSDAPKVVTLDDVYEVTGLDALVAEARSRGEWCCENGCGSGACETCPCCSAGWCVSGVEGVPEDAEAREFWLEVAAEYNPVAAALRAAGEVRS